MCESRSPPPSDTSSSRRSIGAQSGLGYRLVLARRYLLTENIVAILIVVGILAFLADQLVRWLNRRLTGWKARA